FYPSRLGLGVDDLSATAGSVTDEGDALGVFIEPAKFFVREFQRRFPDIRGETFSRVDVAS
ncbi:hypothetical protein C3B61_14700, partial [Cryobacterium zongtaii]